MDKRNLLLYIDIPFCPVHCKHCGKIACAPSSDLRHAYAQALREEIAASADSLPDYEISAVYIGGGIPGHMMDEDLGELLKDLSSWYNIAPDAEITLKVHPGMVSVETLNACRRGYVTRLSVEYVTHNSFEHEMLGRFLSPSAMDITHMILGGSRLDLSFDIIAGLPGQTRTSLLESIKKALSYGASHLSLYPFVLTPGTELAEEYTAKQSSAAAKKPETDDTQAKNAADHPDHSLSRENPRKRIPDPEEVTAWLADVKDYLSSQSFTEYLPGRFALSGKECRYFMLESDGCESLAFGLGAESAFDGVRSKNTASLKKYLQYSDQPEKIICHMEPIL
ncbi:MAG: hypothetical protein LUD16_13630 [Lachnospiraceae bacterium]|nr:hypothetical protein [Lachnospiraceae bacterium]